MNFAFAVLGPLPVIAPLRQREKMDRFCYIEALRQIGYSGAQKIKVVLGQCWGEWKFISVFQKTIFVKYTRAL